MHKTGKFRDREELIELVKDVRSIEDSMKDTDIYQNNSMSDGQQKAYMPQGI